MKTADFSKGCLAEATEILEVCAEARRIYSNLDPYAMTAQFGSERYIDENMLFAALAVEKAIGRMLTHTTWESRERCMRRILKSDDLRVAKDLVGILPRYEYAEAAA